MTSKYDFFLEGMLSVLSVMPSSTPVVAKFVSPTPVELHAIQPSRPEEAWQLTNERLIAAYTSKTAPYKLSARTNA